MLGKLTMIASVTLAAGAALTAFGVSCAVVWGTLGIGGLGVGGALAAVLVPSAPVVEPPALPPMVEVAPPEDDEPIVLRWG